MKHQKQTKMITSNYITTDSDCGYRLVCSSSDPITITLHTPINRHNFELEIDNIGTGTVTCNGYDITQYAHAHVGNNGSEWIIVGGSSTGEGGEPVIVPAVSVYNSSDQSVLKYSSQLLHFDSEEYDTIGMHDSIDNSKLICRIPGKYLVTLYIMFADNSATGMRQIVLARNGVEEALKIVNNDGLRYRDSMALLLDLNFDDYVQFYVYNNTSVTQFVVNGGLNARTRFQMIKVG